MNEAPSPNDPQDEVAADIERRDRLDFEAWNNAVWHGLCAHLHTDDVSVDMTGMPPTHGIAEHIAVMEGLVVMVGGAVPQIVDHPVRSGSGGCASDLSGSRGSSHRGAAIPRAHRGTLESAP